MFEIWNKIKTYVWSKKKEILLYLIFIIIVCYVNYLTDCACLIFITIDGKERRDLVKHFVLIGYKRFSHLDEVFKYDNLEVLRIFRWELQTFRSERAFLTLTSEKKAQTLYYVFTFLELLTKNYQGYNKLADLRPATEDEIYITLLRVFLNLANKEGTLSICIELKKLLKSEEQDCLYKNLLLLYNKLDTLEGKLSKEFILFKANLKIFIKYLEKIK